MENVEIEELKKLVGRVATWHLWHQKERRDEKADGRLERVTNVDFVIGRRLYLHSEWIVVGYQYKNNDN